MTLSRPTQVADRREPRWREGRVMTAWSRHISPVIDALRRFRLIIPVFRARPPPVFPSGHISMNKVYPDAKSALDGLLKDGMMIMSGGFGLCGIAETLSDAIREFRRQEPHRGLQQCRRRRHRAEPAAGDAADQEDDLVLCRREQAVRPAIPGRRTGTRIQSAGHAGRAHPRRRRRHSGLLHQDRRRHADRRRQGSEGIRRREIPDGARPVRRSRHRPRLEGRYRRQPRLSQDRAQLQSDDGDRGEGHRRRGRASGAGRRDRSRPHPYARHFRQAHHRGRHRQEAHRAAHHAQARGRSAATGEEV